MAGEIAPKLKQGIPSQFGNSGLILGTNGQRLEWIQSLPSSTYSNGQVLISNGIYPPFWGNLQPGDISGFPNFNGSSGTILVSSGWYATWQSPSSAVPIDSILPSQSGNSGKFLTTNGSNSSWATTVDSRIASPTFSTHPISSGTGSIAIGDGATNSTITYCIALGYNTQVNSSSGIAIGKNTYSGGGVAIGTGNSSYTSGINIGGSCGGGGVSIGTSCNTYDYSSTAIGFQASCNTSYSLSLGYQTQSGAAFGVAIGYKTNCDFSGEMAFSLGNTGTANSIKTSIVHVWQKITSSSSTNLYVSQNSLGTVYSLKMLTTDNSIYFYDLNLVVGKTGSVTSVNGAYNFKFSLARGSGVSSVVLVGTPIETDILALSGFSVTITADTTNGVPQIAVQYSSYTSGTIVVMGTCLITKLTTG